MIARISATAAKTAKKASNIGVNYWREFWGVVVIASFPFFFSFFFMLVAKGSVGFAFLFSGIFFLYAVIIIGLKYRELTPRTLVKGASTEENYNKLLNFIETDKMWRYMDSRYYEVYEIESSYIIGQTPCFPVRDVWVFIFFEEKDIKYTFINANTSRGIRLPILWPLGSIKKELKKVLKN